MINSTDSEAPIDMNEALISKDQMVYTPVNSDDQDDDDNNSQYSGKRSVRLLSTSNTIISTVEDHPKFNYVLSALCCSYTIAAANEYWVVNWMKMYGVNLPIFNSIVQNASWPLQLFLYRRAVSKLDEPRIITPTMYKNYAFLGTLAAFISLSRMFGLSALPPTLYVICANTEIVFETLMTKFILKRAVTWMQIAAVTLVIAAVAISLYDPDNHRYGSGEGTGESRNIIFMGVGLSLASRFASSLNTILAEKFLGKDAKSMIGVSECAVANSIVPFFLAPIALPVVPEYTKWKEELIHPPSKASLTAIITLLCVALCMSKHVDRLSKYGIVSESSTIFFAGVDSLMKMIAGIGSFFFFGEQINWCIVLGFGLVVGSVLLLYLDKRDKKMKLDALEAERIAKERAENLRNVIESESHA